MSTSNFYQIKLAISEWRNKCGTGSVRKLINLTNKLLGKKNFGVINLYASPKLLPKHSNSYSNTIRSSEGWYLLAGPESVEQQLISKTFERRLNLGTDISLLELRFFLSKNSPLSRHDAFELLRFLAERIEIEERTHLLSKLEESRKFIHDTARSPESRFRIFLNLIAENYCFFRERRNIDFSSIQYFTYKDEEELFLRGTTADDPPNFSVLVNKSIVGLSISTDNPIIIDPRSAEFQELYLNYTYTKKETRCEMCFRIKYKKRVIGVLNLESRIFEYMDYVDFALIARYFGILSEIFRYLEGQWALTYQQSRIFSNIHEFYFQAHTKSLNHDLQSFYSLGAYLNLLKLSLTEIDSKDKIPFDNAIQKVKDFGDIAEGSLESKSSNNIDGVIEESINYFRTAQNLIHSHIRQFSQMRRQQKFKVVDLIHEAVKNFRVIQKEGTSIPIRIDVDIGEEFELTEYPIVGAYIYQLLDNSRRHLNEKGENNPSFKARIRISYRVLEIDNNQWLEQYGELSIRDNGSGVDRDTLRELRKWDPGLPTIGPKRRGTGTALAGVYRYMKRQGGWLIVDSRNGSYFDVRLVFRLGVGKMYDRIDQAEL